MAYAEKQEIYGDGNDLKRTYGSSDDLIQTPAADRNKGPILEVLQQYFSEIAQNAFVFEVASGPGQHIVHFAQHFPSIVFLPSDCDLSYLRSIQAYIHKTGVKNVLPPVNIDITQPVSQWEEQKMLKPATCDAIININMIHISPWETCEGLLTAAGQLLKTGGFLYMYGPFKINGRIFPESNSQFDAMLRSRNASWGLREINDVKALAEQNGLRMETMVDMPANNKSVLFFKK
ncbi:methyltransferase-like 26 [Pomacea canaliculata]|uniref:methyltransferase-like 26 n=1 Tax=Pomacea canaliculata TaxID=400727 RepID=UPI000D7375E6|nr:methyltransferase-like 26 [Pomacea canaliculata]